MKKLGFTLSELLVAIGIVAVGASLVAPTISSIIPDKNKIKVINCYNKINEINQKLLNAPDLYTSNYTYNDGSQTLVSFGFADTTVSLRYKNNPKNFEYKDKYKYPNLFSLMLIGELYPNGGMDFGSNSKIELEKQIFDHNNTPSTATIYLNLYIDGDHNSKNCYYNLNTCKNPDIFKFKIDESGNVTAGDAMTDAYLTTIGKSNSQKEDKELAKKYFIERTYN